MRNERAIVRQLLAIRELVDGVLEELTEQPPACQHKNKDDQTAFGGPEKWRCRDCGYDYEGTADD